MFGGSRTRNHNGQHGNLWETGLAVLLRETGLPKIPLRGVTYFQVADDCQ